MLEFTYLSLLRYSSVDLVKYGKSSSTCPWNELKKKQKQKVNSQSALFTSVVRIFLYEIIWTKHPYYRKKVAQLILFHLHNIRKIKKPLNPDWTRTLVNPFVTSGLDFFNNLMYGLPKSWLPKLQLIQNATARLICHAGCFHHMVEEHVTESSERILKSKPNYR